MRIVFAAQKNDLKSVVDAHFARCQWLCVFDTETQDCEFIQNIPGFESDKTGITTTNLLGDKDIHIAVAGRFGSKVVEKFRKNGIQMIIPEKEKTITEILKLIK
jgi:predicted Fe-Mo cluster-binding NifX family protein